MYGFTTVLDGITFDEALAKTVAALKAAVLITVLLVGGQKVMRW